jgi:hypothetical protein
MRDSIHTMREPLQMQQIRERAHICSHSVEPALEKDDVNDLIQSYLDRKGTKMKGIFRQ